MTVAPVPEIPVHELAERRADGTPLVDVRTAEEYAAGHVAGATSLPLQELGERHTELPSDRTVLVICQSGGRSAQAVEALNGAGYDAVNVAGGTSAWMAAGGAVVEGSEAG